VPLEALEEPAEGLAVAGLRGSDERDQLRLSVSSKVMVMGGS
jgi:hypothetical protein